MGLPYENAKPAAADIRVALRERFPPNSHALMFEVGNGTGSATRRHADAVAMGLWPSRGLEIEGVEIKVSRSDWKRELADHAKADAIQRYCDRWWIAAPKGLIPPAELPVTWGLLEFDGASLRQKVPAPKLEAAPPDRTFIAAMLRRASEADAEEVKRLVQKSLAPMVEQERRNIEARYPRIQSEAAGVLAKLSEIKAATGIDLRGWTPASSIIAAMKFALRIGIAGECGRLEQIAKEAERLAAEIRGFIGGEDC